MLSIKDFDFASASETPYRLQLKDEVGKKLPVFFHVIGSESEAFKKAVYRIENAARKERAEAAKQSWRNNFKPIEADIEEGNELTAERVVGWEGIEEKFDRALLARLFERNAHFAKQVTDCSNNSGNFSGQQAKNSKPSPDTASS